MNGFLRTNRVYSAREKHRSKSLGIGNWVKRVRDQLSKLCQSRIKTFWETLQCPFVTHLVDYRIDLNMFTNTYEYNSQYSRLVSLESCDTLRNKNMIRCTYVCIPHRWLEVSWNDTGAKRDTSTHPHMNRTFWALTTVSAIVVGINFNRVPISIYV